MVRVKRVAAFLSLGVIALTSLPADAAAPPAVFKDSAGTVYVHSGVSAGQKLKVEYIGQAFKKTVKAGACGQITLGTNASMPRLGNSVVVGNMTINLATVVTATTPLPKCTNGTWKTTPSANYKTATKVYLVGYTPQQSYVASFPDVDNHFNATVNGCAFATIKSTPSRPMPSAIKIDGTSYTVSSLTTTDPPLCRKTGSTVTLYTPPSWNS